MPAWIALGLSLDWGVARAVHLASAVCLAPFDLALESSWSIVAAGAFAAALPFLAAAHVVGSGLSPAVLEVVNATSVIPAFMPHLWTVGRAVRQASRAPVA